MLTYSAIVLWMSYVWVPGNEFKKRTTIALISIDINIYLIRTWKLINIKFVISFIACQCLDAFVEAVSVKNRKS